MGGKAVAEAVLRLTQRGREAGIHVVAATQRPAAAMVGGMVKANFPVRLVGSVVSAEDAKVAAGLPGTGAERLLGRGDFLLVAKGQVIRFQAAYAGIPELGALVGRVRAGGRRRRSWGVPELPAEGVVR
jgi:S-DNA-T family DNA segregation ATPase FtsK/SpoIIIE